MHVVDNWKCTNMHQYDSIIQEMIKQLTHIFLSSHENIVCISLKTQQSINKYGIQSILKIH